MKHSNKNIKTARGLQRSRLSIAISGALLLGVMGATDNAQALEFDFGDWTANLDTTITYGIGIRVQERDEDLVGFANLLDNPSAFTTQELIDLPFGTFSVNGDDGNLNYDQWDLYTNQVRVTSELDITNGQYGGFFRATYYYDFENENRSELSEDARRFVGTDLQLLDAYLYADFDFASIRLGRQVVSWGESTFIQNGINVINPVNVAALRSAGAELRNAFLPVEMVWTSVPINQSLSLEAVYLFEFEQIDPDPAGTYFSDNDFAVPGGEYALLGFGLLDDDRLPDGSLPFGALPRAPDRAPSDGDAQFGAAIRYYAENFNDGTEFGFYYLHYNSRLPLISGTAVTNSSLSSGTFFVEYPEGIDLFGVSFNTTLGGTVSLAGEITHRDDQPYQIDDVEVLFAGLTPLNSVIAEPVDRFVSQLGEFSAGEEIRGFIRREVTQAQFTLTQIFGPNNFLGADQLALVGEVGATKVWDLPNPNVLRLNGPATNTGGGFDETTGNFRNPVTQVDGFPDSFSWGYRAVLAATYNNAIGSVNLAPRIAFNHDVNGTTPGPGGNFIDGRKQITLGLNATYLASWSASLAYTINFGAKEFNTLHDRDFVTIAISYAF